MKIWESILLGAVQGLTEFLPVSSSGHLVIFEHLLPGITTSGVLFDVFLHLGTLLAVLVFFRKKLMKISFNYLWLLALGTIPAGIIGIVFQDVIEGLFTDVRFVGIALLVTGVINYLTDKNKEELGSKIDIKKSLGIGLAQSFAIAPGISRSGSTIFAGTKLGLNKKDAAEFSFLLSIPAILGANLVQIVKYGVDFQGNWGIFLSGFAAAFIFGFIAIGFLIKLLVANKLKYFSFYCFVVGILVIILT